jgi:hypothetical protein
MPSRAHLVAERRQERAVVGELAFGNQHVGARRLAGPDLGLHQGQVLLVIGDDVLGRLDLQPGGRDVDRLAYRTAAQRQVGGCKLVGLGPAPLACAPTQPTSRPCSRLSVRWRTRCARSRTTPI